MRKIPSIFVRRERSNLVDLERITASCEWVFSQGEGKILTVKRDGTPLLYRKEVWYQRRTLKSRLDPGTDGFPKPADFTPCQPTPEYDDESKQWEWPGWMPLDTQYKKLLDEAIISRGEMKAEDDGYSFELCGPKINGNPEGLNTHQLFVHASEVIALQSNVLTVEVLVGIVKTIRNEGIVIYSGRQLDMGMECAKLKRRDLGFDWPIKTEAKN